jgi:uncharacterized damage-inducible protein DinB
MSEHTLPLTYIYDGWQGHQQSITRTIAGLTREQLTWRPAPTARSAGELAAHISGGRITWFARLDALGSAELSARAATVPPQMAVDNATELVRWLDDSWQMIERTLASWTITDLAETYRYAFQGKTYAISRQWTIWHILAHDLVHSGEMALVLGMQGIALPELGDFFGHITMPPLVDSL